MCDLFSSHVFLPLRSSRDSQVLVPATSCELLKCSWLLIHEITDEGCRIGVGRVRAGDDLIAGDKLDSLLRGEFLLRELCKLHKLIEGPLLQDG